MKQFKIGIVGNGFVYKGVGETFEWINKQVNK